jgi:hypothetical protein
MSKRKIGFVSFAVLFSIVVVLASNNIFEEDPGYRVIPHGDHNHYVPHEYDETIGVHQFPQRPPREGERITPDGRIVRDSETGIQFFDNSGNTSDAPEDDAGQESGNAESTP